MRKVCYAVSMKNANICRRILTEAPQFLIAEHFIYEQQIPRAGEYRTIGEFAMYLVENGTAEFASGGYYRSVCTGCAFFVFAGQPFRLKPDPDFHCYSIRFYGDRVDALLRRFKITPGNAVFEGLQGLLPLWRESIARVDGQNADLIGEGLLLLAFSKLKSVSVKKESVVERMLEYVEQHFTDADLKLSTLAESMGYTDKYLSHAFRQHCGMGFSEYVRAMRIRYAVTLLENGVTSVKHVAALSGFADPLYFTRVFTQSVGVSPSRYAKKEE